MIEKERLQELIDKEEVIWSVSPYNEAFEMWLTGDVKIRDDYALQFGSSYIETYMISDLYETQAEAEWVAKMHTEYTEYFNPPLFENLPYEYSFKFIRNGVEHELFCKRDSYIIVISCCKDYMSGTEDMDYTKENYIKAVEMTYKLFKGEEE